MKSETATIRIPCSTSNLGSGFDTLGLALNLYNKVRLARVKAEGARPKSHIATRMIDEAASLFFRRTKKRPFPFAFASSYEIPIGRGLGASAALRVAVLAGLQILSGSPMDREKILQLGTELEGHPDNVSPELFGGFTASGIVERNVRCLQYPVSDKLEIITLIPEFKVDTEAARKLLPSEYSRADTAHALNRAALITGAFASEQYEALRGLFDDRVHQPCREVLIPQLRNVIEAGEDAGALGGFLSGSGSAIICLSLRNGAAIGRAMQRQLRPSRVYRLRADNAGCQVF